MSIVKDSILTFSTQILVVFLSGTASIVIARALGPSGKGIFAIILVVPTLLVTLGNMGLGVANIYFLGKEKYKLDEITSNSVIFAFSIGIGLVFIFSMIFNLLNSSFLKEVKPWHILSVIYMLPLALLILYFKSILLGENKIKEYNLVQVLEKGSFLLLIIIFLLIIKEGVLGTVLSWILTVVITSSGSFLLVRQLTRITFSLNFNLLKDSIKFGIKGYLANAIQLLNYRLDMLLVNFFLGVTFVGYYSIAVLLAEMLWYFPDSVGTVIFPKVSSVKFEVASELTPKVCRNTLFLTFISSLLLFVFGKKIIFIAFGELFLPALQPLWVLLPGVVALSIAKVLANDLTGRGKPMINTYTAMVSLAINIGLNLILIPRWGIIGAAFASTISYITTAMIILYSFLRITHNTLTDTIIIKLSDFRVYSELYKKIAKNRGF